MRHLRPEAIERANDEAITHLEGCQQCRSALEVDVDLQGVRRQIIGQVTDTPMLTRQTSTRSWRWSSNRWVVAAVAAAAVVVIILPVVWFGFPTGPDTADSDSAGSPEAIEMYETQPGPPLALAGGDGWAISIRERGPGFCIRESAANADTERCLVSSQMTIPGVLVLDRTTFYEEDQPKSGTALGIVTEQADEIIIRFSTGIERQLTPGHTVRLGYRGFGLLYDAAEIGLPVEVEIFDDGTSLAVYSDTDSDQLPTSVAG